MITSTSFAFAWTLIHLLGLVVSVMVRTHLGGRFEGLVQSSFLVCLMAVALATVIGYYDCFQMWPLSAITLSLMIVFSVLDFNTGRSLPANLEA